MPKALHIRSKNAWGIQATTKLNITNKVVISNVFI